jgi:hypothetical protein
MLKSMTLTTRLAHTDGVGQKRSPTFGSWIAKRCKRSIGISDERGSNA